MIASLMQVASWAGARHRGCVTPAQRWSSADCFDAQSARIKGHVGPNCSKQSHLELKTLALHHCKISCFVLDLTETSE
jgi:hypothetical protein